MSPWGSSCQALPNPKSGSARKRSAVASGTRALPLLSLLWQIQVSCWSSAAPGPMETRDTGHSTSGEFPPITQRERLQQSWSKALCTFSSQQPLSARTGSRSKSKPSSYLQESLPLHPSQGSSLHQRAPREQGRPSPKHSHGSSHWEQDQNRQRQERYALRL